MVSFVLLTRWMVVLQLTASLAVRLDGTWEPPLTSPPLPGLSCLHGNSIHDSGFIHFTSLQISGFYKET